jgi:signal transduction histidine kinase
MTSEAKTLPDPLMKPYHVWLYLKELGYSVSLEQPKRDIKAQKLIPLKSGGFSQASVRRYAMACKLKRSDPAPGSPDTAAPSGLPLDDVGAGAEKIAQQARLARLQADKIELALERDKGNLVPAADLAITLASFAAVVEHELKNSLRTKAGKLIALVEGDAKRKATLVRELTDLVDAGLRHAASIEEYRVQFESLGDARP